MLTLFGARMLWGRVGAWTLGMGRIMVGSIDTFGNRFDRGGHSHGWGSISLLLVRGVVQKGSGHPVRSGSCEELHQIFQKPGFPVCSKLCCVLCAILCTRAANGHPVVAQVSSNTFQVSDQVAGDWQ